jgi:DNA-binding FadR family transcriptional regulator
MSGMVRDGPASSSACGVARCHGFVRRIFDAIRRAHERKAAREVERHLGLSGQKLTDEMERKMMERLTRNQNFRP